MWIRFNESNVDTHSKELVRLLDQEIHGMPNVKLALAKILAKPKIPLIQNTGGPLGVIMIPGPTGVGKTEIGHALAQILYGWRDRLTYIPCDNFQESHSIARLIGSPPGYVNNGDATPLADTMLFRGYEEAKEAGRLHELVQGRSGSAILMFDEIEKAHPMVRQGLLTALSTGVFRLTSGKEINSDSRNHVEHSIETPLHNTIIILTSNVGEHEFAIQNDHASIGFQNAPPIAEKEREKHFLRELKREFSPEFLGRIDYIERVGAHTIEDSRAVAEIMIGKWKRSMWATFGDKIEIVSDTPALVNALVKNVTPELGSRLLGRMFKQRVEDVFENGIPEYFLDSLEGTNYVCKIGVNGSGDIEFNLDPTRKKFANQVKNRAKNAELDKLPEIIAAINRYQAVAYLSDFNADLRMELEAELKKRRRTLYELGVGQTMLRKLDGGNVENYVRFLDQFLYTYDGVTNDIDEELEMELATLKGMIRHAQKVERRKGIPVIDTMLMLLDNTGYHELNQTQLQKLGNFIHQQQLNAMGIG